METNTVIFLWFLGFVLSCYILYFIIKTALDQSHQSIINELMVQNQLIRKSLGIKSTNEEELEENYKRGYYTESYYKKFKKQFRK